MPKLLVTYVPPKPRRKRRKKSELPYPFIVGRMPVNWQKYYIRNVILYLPQRHHARIPRKYKKTKMHQGYSRLMPERFPANDNRMSYKYDLIKRNELIKLRGSYAYNSFVQMYSTHKHAYAKWKRKIGPENRIGKKIRLAMRRYKKKKKCRLRRIKVIYNKLKREYYQDFLEDEEERLFLEEEERKEKERLAEEAKIIQEAYKKKMKEEEEKLGNSVFAAYYRNAARMVDFKF